MESIEIKIARDFIPTPSPRYIREGDFSGELFRQKILFPEFNKAFAQGKKIIVDLDGTAGYGTSFLEESFGGLIREEKLEYERIISNLELISNEEEYLIDDIKGYLKDAGKETKKEDGN